MSKVDTPLEWQIRVFRTHSKDHGNTYDDTFDAGQRLAKEFVNRNKADIKKFKLSTAIGDSENSCSYYVYVWYLSEEALE
ncbi:hypothetical protein HN858_00825 [Candidatus Falkowbacteria bacterium]|jgi:hypothetical protein|nr:hypothetical protein [Candidatus Falkowbacteria bacterium]MBT5503512.1 hypothetical protein [Candidatus Falkowbacteria bacterium]MBT6573984.1 hypothetical protein [Candidatus Falkowbacteria bacterium]MBT7348197.1 hypothetical protein [Candidatus Falkowbacteria bacterium]MBT7500176.1 hypothetical protein [Candidatus Falkowbacteria bacterium]